MTNRHICYALLCLLFLAAASGDSTDDCVYTLYVKTGSGFKAGTDSKISVTLGDAYGRSAWAPDLENWGLMGPSHDYYERGNVDIFSGRAPCVSGPLCRINVTSDGLGSHHGWYCDYVEVTTTGSNRECSQTIFYVEQWLGTDVSPYKLEAILDGCNRKKSGVQIGAARKHRRNERLVVRKSEESVGTAAE